jgi:hypothetical protein
MNPCYCPKEIAEVDYENHICKRCGGENNSAIENKQRKKKDGNSKNKV